MQECRKSIKTISRELCTDRDTAYAMILMTAMLMDLDPADPEVVDMILQDYGDDVA